MKELRLSPTLIVRMEEIYHDMEAAYDQVAQDLNFGCSGCTDNCCDSYFLHHTYAEWSYLWLGIDELPQQKKKEVLERAHSSIIAAETAMQRKERPQLMCPLNENGLCMVYKYRLMVCRTHGVPAQITRPDGKTISFPGCFRCQELVKEQGNPPIMVERTAMLTKLALLEQEYLENKRHLYPRVRLTIAEMLVKGPPELP